MLALYAAIKFLAYSGWCWVGLGLFRPGAEKRAATAFVFGGIRLAMGLGFGVVIYILATATAIALQGNQPLVYLLVYVPVRWVEWGLIDTFLRPGPFDAWSALLGPDATTRGWRLRGILLSCLADIPVVVSMGGLPLGRFMC